MLDEVRTELGFTDLQVFEGADDHLVNWLSKAPQKALASGPTYQDRWRQLGSQFMDDYVALRDSSFGPQQVRLGRRLKANIAEVTDQRVRW
ncbi:MAG: hypothetical protein KY469_21965 [Actinobacteria bacterium]|nr:hypothetical protein [Actinomycetota bacterium]